MKPIFIDVDGTLRNSQKEITDPTCTALLLAQAKGYEPILCTGRPRDYALKLCAQLQSNYLIYNSGAGIYDCNAQEVLYENPMSAKSIVSLYDLLRNENVVFNLAYDGSNHRYSLGEHKKYDHLNQQQLQDILNHNKIVQVVIDSANFEFMLSLRAKINQIPQIKTSNQSKCLIDLSIPHTIVPNYYYDVVDEHTSKGNGVKKFCELMQLSTENCIAIGDDENDISMFKVCDYSVAMDNALPKVKQLAKYITLDNDHDGVANFINQQLLH